MADDDDKEEIDSSNKVTPLPTELLKFTRLVDQSLRAADRAQPSTDNPRDDGSCLEPLQAKAAPASQVEARVKKNDESDVMEALIGLGLILVGLTTMVVVLSLPRRGATPVFVGASLIFVIAGGRRIDKATRSHRAARREAGLRKRRP